MKVFVVALVVVVGVVLARPQEEYTHKYDGIDLEEILGSKRLTDNYGDCLLDKRPCTPDGAELKRVLPDALKTKCSKCSDFQKERAKYALKIIYQKRNDLYKKLEAKYDPEGIYLKENEEEFKKIVAT